MAVDHNGRACLREAARNGCADILSRSGNDRDASVEVRLVHGRHQRAPFVGLGYSTLQYPGWIRRRTGWCDGNHAIALTDELIEMRGVAVQLSRLEVI